MVGRLTSRSSSWIELAVSLGPSRRLPTPGVDARNHTRFECTTRESSPAGLVATILTHVMPVYAERRGWDAIGIAAVPLGVTGVGAEHASDVHRCHSIEPRPSYTCKGWWPRRGQGMVARVGGARDGSKGRGGKG